RKVCRSRRSFSRDARAPRQCVVPGRSPRADNRGLPLRLYHYEGHGRCQIAAVFSATSTVGTLAAPSLPGARSLECSSHRQLDHLFANPPPVPVAEFASIGGGSPECLQIRLRERAVNLCSNALTPRSGTSQSAWPPSRKCEKNS